MFAMDLNTHTETSRFLMRSVQPAYVEAVPFFA